MRKLRLRNRDLVTLALSECVTRLKVWRVEDQATGGLPMLTNVNQVKGLVIRATDGEIGTVDQLYFDDETWAIRYLTAATGGWLSDREVLISPFSVTNVDWQGKRLDVALTKKQIENSPNRDTQRPVSRQYESEYLGYYNYPNYWSGPFLWGPGAYPSSLSNRIATPKDVLAEKIRRESMDSHLRSTGLSPAITLRLRTARSAMWRASW